MNEENCPIPNSHDRFNEAHFYISEMLNNYHDPDRFRWNLNSFLQTLRNVTFTIQKELNQKQGFQKWYEEQQNIMKSDELLKKFVDGRNMVVKERNLKMNSQAEIGLFRGRKLKLAFVRPVPVDVHSSQLLENYKGAIIGMWIGEEHATIDEQVGIKRVWIVKELGEGETVDLCDVAWSRIGIIISNAHEFCKFKLDPPKEHSHDIDNASVMLESDVDPTLPKKWGWIE